MSSSSWPIRQQQQQQLIISSNGIGGGVTTTAGVSSRRQTTIQIRKQRKDDVLRRKRGIITTTQLLSPIISTTTTTTTTGTVISKPRQPIDTKMLYIIIEDFCHGTESNHHQEEEEVTITTSTVDINNTGPIKIKLLITLYEAITILTPRSIVVSTVHQCLRTNRTLFGYQLIHRLMNFLPTHSEMVATILVELTSIPLDNKNNINDDCTVSSSTNSSDERTNLYPNTSKNDLNTDYHYYYSAPTSSTSTSGMLPYNWYELFDVSNIQNSSATTVVQQQQQQPSSQYRSNYDTYLSIMFQIICHPHTCTKVVELLCHLIGNLVLQPSTSMVDATINNTDTTGSSINNASHQQQQQLLQPPPSMIFMETVVTESYWSILISKLPYSTYCCACIIRTDQVHYTMDFLRPLLDQQQQHMTRTNTETNVIRDTFIPLLERQNEMICVETAWILEGLTRREGLGMYTLFSISDNDTLLLGSLIQQIGYHTNVLRFSSSQRSTGSTTNDVELSNAFLVPSLRTICNIAVGLDSQDYGFLLTSTTELIDIITISIEQCYVIDAISVVRVISIMSLEEAIKCMYRRTESVLQLQDHVSKLILPLVNILTTASSRLEWKRESVFCLIDILLEHCIDDNVRRLIIQDYVWKKLIFSDVRDHPTLLIRSLLDMLQLSDMDIKVATMKLLNIILRYIDDSRIIFIHTPNGVDLLNDICSTTNNSYDEYTQDLAIQLLEDFFESENDDNDEAVHDGIHTTGSTFMFGMQPAAAPYDFLNGNQHQQQPSHGQGRGRGRVVPAWMSQQQPQ